MGDCLVVTQVTSFSRNGLSDWLIQRVSSLIILAYFLFSVQITNGIDYTSWRALHDTTAMKVFTLLATGAYVAHAWIGLWSVFTDYLTEYMLVHWKHRASRTAIAVVLALVVYAIWVIQ